MRLVVFSDLDGTLLDHADYSYSAAEPALARLAELGIPLIFVTSKTRAEVEQLQREMTLEEPFVAENGGGVFFPGKYDEMEIPGSVATGSYRLVTLGRAYREVRDFLTSLPSRFLIEGFGDMNLERIVELTGLSKAEAELASQRDFTEPFRLEDEGQLAELSARANARGFAITCGGRFCHLMGDGQDKGRAVELVSDAFRRFWQSDVTSIGLGDSPNDLPMLERVDFPVVIPRPSSEVLNLESPQRREAETPGSSGWNAAILELVGKLY